jgi:hypothetical protein
MDSARDSETVMGWETGSVKGLAQDWAMGLEMEMAKG